MDEGAWIERVERCEERATIDRNKGEGVVVRAWEDVRGRVKLCIERVKRCEERESIDRIRGEEMVVRAASEDVGRCVNLRAGMNACVRAQCLGVCVNMDVDVGGGVGLLAGMCNCASLCGMHL